MGKCIWCRGRRQDSKLFSSKYLLTFVPESNYVSKSLQSVIYNSALPSAERDALYDSLYSLIPTQVQSYQNSWASDFSRILQTFDPSNPGERPVLTTSSTATPTLSESLAASVSVSASANVPVSVSPSVSASPSASASSSSSASAGRTEVLVHGAVAGAIGIGAVLL